MKSSPVILALCVVLLWGAAGFLLPKNRAPASPSAVPPSEAPSAGTPLPTWATLRFAHPPQNASLHLDDLTLWTAPLPVPQQIETEFTLSPEDADRLILRGTWADSTQATAITLSLEPDGQPTREATLWITGTADHNFPFRSAEDLP